MKTVKFKDPKYVGDPLNAVRIFNEKEVDELMVLDIDATSLEKKPNYQLIQNLAAECRMPLCYGGGIKTVDEAQYIFSLGVEKIALSASAIDSPELITEIAKRVGSQSVVVVLDVKKKLLGHKYELYSHNGKKSRGVDPIEFARRCEELGAGEIIINSIDRDGTMEGYDHILVDKVRSMITVPMTVLGGAGSLADIGSLFQQHGIIGAAAGSLFVFKGKYKAVLINYPRPSEKDQVISKYFGQSKY